MITNKNCGMVKQLATNDPRHGTVNGYVYYDCRCDLCREAGRIRNAKRTKPAPSVDRLTRKERRDRAAAAFTADDPRHGTAHAYEYYGCRCDRCCDAKTATNALVYENSGNRQLIRELKSAPCVDCGGTFPSECMDFDHRDPVEKSFQISSSTTRSRAAILAEIAKCDIVCSNCHRVRTYAQRKAGLIRAGRPRKA